MNPAGRPAPLSLGRVLTLRSGPYLARIAPAAGGRIAALQWTAEGRSHDLVVPLAGGDFDPHRWPKAGVFPMVPFANRLPADGFEFRGQRVRLQAGPDGFPVHGFTHRSEWRVVAHSGEHAQIEYTHDGVGEGWPWAFSAQQHIELDDRGLAVRLAVKNLSGTAMPLGMGLHPYHPCDAGGSPDVRLQAQGRAKLDAEGAALAAAGPASPVMIPGETAAFSGWSGRFEMRTAALQVEVVAEGWPHLVMHRPRSADYLCVEPVTLLPGGLLEEALPPHAILAPGQQCFAMWRCVTRPVSTPGA